MYGGSKWGKDTVLWQGEVHFPSPQTQQAVWCPGWSMLSFTAATTTIFFPLLLLLLSPQCLGNILPCVCSRSVSLLHSSPFPGMKNIASHWEWSGARYQSLNLSLQPMLLTPKKDAQRGAPLAWMMFPWIPTIGTLFLHHSHEGLISQKERKESEVVMDTACSDPAVIRRQ